MSQHSTMRPVARFPFGSARTSSQTHRGLVRLVAMLAAIVSVLLPGRAHAERPLSVWHHYRGEEARAIEILSRRFEAAHPGARVETLAVPFDAFSAKLEGAAPTGHGPDVFLDAHERLGTFVRDRIAVPVDASVFADETERFGTTPLESVTMQGKRYAVPLALKALALYVNPTHFPERPTSLEAVAALQPRLPAGSYAIAYETESPFFHAAVLHGFGGRMLGDDDAFGMIGPEAENSIRYVRDLTERGVVPTEPSGALVLDLFVSGQAAAVIGGPWLESDIKGRVNYDVHPLPPIREGGEPMRSFLSVEGGMVTARGANHPLAAAWLRHIASDESAKVRATIGRQIVTNANVWADPEIAKDASLVAFHEASRASIPTPSSAAMRATWVPAQQAIRKVLRGDAEPDFALAEAKRRFDDVMRPLPERASPTPGFVALGLALAGLAFFVVRRARTASFRSELKASLPAYRYVAHAAVITFALVIVPLVAGAVMSLFVGPRGEMHYVGLANYVSILTARGGPLLGHGSFYLTLLVTVLWTVVNVLGHVIIGLALGTALSKPWMRLRAVYRVLLILPWAVPNYVTALAWKGMFHRQFGAVNGILTWLGAEPISWFAKFSTAFAANVATNVWLGFPFMMVVTLGGLTSIPKDVLEAAEVDGATRWQRFRYVTLPLLRPTLLPAVVLGSVWTFNMFNVVFLVSGGEPDGTTDILVSEAYRWAFTRNAQYGYAAAYAVLIFLLLAFTMRFAGKRLMPDAGAST